MTYLNLLLFHFNISALASVIPKKGRILGTIYKEEAWMWYTKAYSRIVPLIFCISFRAWDWWPSWRDENILVWYWWSSPRHQPSEILDLKVCYKIWWSLNLWSIEWSSKQRQGLMFLLSNTNVVWTKPWITIYVTLLSITMF